MPKHIRHARHRATPPFSLTASLLSSAALAAALSPTAPPTSGSHVQDPPQPFTQSIPIQDIPALYDQINVNQDQDDDDDKEVRPRRAKHARTDL